MLRYSSSPSIIKHLPLFRRCRRFFSNRIQSLTRPEILDRISRILTLERFDAVSKLPFDFSDDDLLDSVLFNLRLNPNASTRFFQLALKQLSFRPNPTSYCKIVHILSNGRFFDDARGYLMDLIRSTTPRPPAPFLFNEIPTVFKEFSFSATVFDMLLKAYVEAGLVKDAVFVFDNMGRYGKVPSNSLLSGLVRIGDSQTAVLVYEQMARVGIPPAGVFTVSIMVNAYRKGVEVDKASEFVGKIEKKGFEVNQVAYHSLIDG